MAVTRNGLPAFRRVPNAAGARLQHPGAGDVAERSCSHHGYPGKVAHERERPETCRAWLTKRFNKCSTPSLRTCATRTTIRHLRVWLDVAPTYTASWPSPTSGIS